ncbi:hypothetical protein ES815_03205 [Leclercia adecarboxylata]|uniref:Uncharacterized protein n=1 Tax=Leclercia adecarboxylata TaxID=83655 RepID=A0AAP9D9N5_9ENTR|nr:hypothetical protein [Leclercia adecarboxylata]QDK17370.1 hypothetical protein ES815_03205 [Leclercia adecarboxylata]
MTDTLKDLEQDRNRKAQAAMELHAKWKVACIEAKAAKDAYLKARGRDVGKARAKFNTAPVEPHSPPPMTDDEKVELEALIASDTDEPKHATDWWMERLIGEYRRGGGEVVY